MSDCDPMDCSTPGFPVHHPLPELAQTHIHLILCRPLLLLPSIFSSIRVFSNESALCIRWPKYWSFSFSISSFNEYSGLISFRIDQFDLTIQGTLKSLLKYHSSKASILQHSTFFMVQLFVTPQTAARQASLSITNSQNLLKLTSISSSVVPFSFHLQSFPASRSFLMSWLFVSGGQIIGASVSASVLSVNI